MSIVHECWQWGRTPNRRDWLRLSLAGSMGLAGWLPRLAAEAAHHPDRKRSCILLWMDGGPSQMDTFDLKPGHTNGGPFKAIATATSGMQISEHLPLVAKQSNHLAVIRSMKSREGDHGRASHLLRTGVAPQGPIDFPTIGSLIAKELERPTSDLPGYVSVGGRVGTPGYSAGFLGPRFGPVAVGGEGQRFGEMGTPEISLQIRDVKPPLGLSRSDQTRRLDLLQEMQREFLEQHPGITTSSHSSAYERASRLMKESAAKAFALEDEPASLRDQYGRNRFGQGCLLARRLVERDVPFVEVVLGGWDTHDNNFEQVKNLSQTLDRGWATLLEDLQRRGLLATTQVIWMGEFGRTPVINTRVGRDHFPHAWSVVLGGGGIRGGQVVGKTTSDGMSVEDKAVTVPDLLSTICHGLGIDPMKQNPSNVGRPIRLVDPNAKPIIGVVA